MLYDFRAVIRGTVDIPDHMDEEKAEEYIFDMIQGAGFFNMEKYDITVEDFVES